MTKRTEQPKWHRAPCASNNCIEVAKVADRFLIRDSKDPDAAPISVSPGEWEAFVQGVRTGTFDFD
jgi:hypothetical protein